MDLQLDCDHRRALDRLADTDLVVTLNLVSL